MVACKPNAEPYIEAMGHRDYILVDSSTLVYQPDTNNCFLNVLPLIEIYLMVVAAVDLGVMEVGVVQEVMVVDSYLFLQLMINLTKTFCRHLSMGVTLHVVDYRFFAIYRHHLKKCH